MEARYWIHTVTPLHVGAGRGLGYIDLPIAREKVTNWPYIPGSSIKGVIADYHCSKRRNENLAWKDLDNEKIRKELGNEGLKAAFGVSGGNGASDSSSGSAGSLIFTDAHILCLPVRSFYGTFAWVTSPFCLERFKRDMRENVNVPAPAQDQALIADGSVLQRNGGKIYLEELDIAAFSNEETTTLAGTIANALFTGDEDWKNIFKQRFAIVDDDVFTFLCDMGTEVNAHIRIDEETGVVAEKALWYEETLPVETILTGEVWCDRSYVGGISSDSLFDKFCTGTLDLQIGGKASTGKGQVRCVFESIGAGD